MMDSSRLLRSKAAEFSSFVYNKQTREFFGRTCKSWGKTVWYCAVYSTGDQLLLKFLLLSFFPAQIGVFFLVFYGIVGGIFAAHLAIFVGITPHPAEDVHPWNFGRYAYPNYPNSKIGIRALYNNNLWIHLVCSAHG